MKTLWYGAGLIGSFLLGLLASTAYSTFADEPVQPPREKAAYLVASWKILHPDQLKPFSDAAVPLAEKAGYKPLGGAEPVVLEGNWPYEGVLIVQKYDSMRALLDFWRSPEHAAAIKLREGHIDSHFVVAVEAHE